MHKVQKKLWNNRQVSRDKLLLDVEKRYVMKGNKKVERSSIVWNSIEFIHVMRLTSLGNTN